MRAPAFVVIAALGTTGCDDAFDALRGDGLHEHTDDEVDGWNADGHLQGMAVAGRWIPDPDAVAASVDADVIFTDAPPYNGGANCSGGATAGALTFRDLMLGFWPQLGTIGIYNCRVIAGTNSMSIHGVGRALDLMLPTTGGDADNGLGDPIANWLVENAEAIGVQTVIWDSTIWRVSRNPQTGAYTGSNPHVDHIHVELSVKAASEDTDWFASPYGPEACDPVTAPVTVDEGSACFHLFGPAQYWRSETAGVGGQLWWTNAYQGANPSNFARWSLPLTNPGTYVVEVAVNETWGVYDATRYRVVASGAESVVTVDQSAASGWVALGEFAFTGDGSESVTVEDNASGTVPADQHIVADALRLVVPTVEPTDPPEEPTDPPEEPTDPPDEPTDPPDERTDPPDEPALPGEDPGPADDDDPGVNETIYAPSVEARGGCATTPAPLAIALAALALLRRRR